MEKYHFSSITEHNQALGLSEPEHPLFCVTHTKSDKPGGILSCKNDVIVSTDFYTVSIKRIISGEVVYGRTKYDCQNGTMIFTAPGQEVGTKGVKVNSEGRVLIIHPDYIRGHAVYEQIKKYHFFDYAIHEALHLSPKEECQVRALFDSIETEYHNNQDDFSKELILDLLTTLLRYANRFYHRQFLMRKESQNSLYQRFKSELSALIEADSDYKSLPAIEEISNKLHVTSRYLSDALKAETGKTAKEWVHLELIELAKDMLLSSDASVSTIAYQLGFEYPNYFARLFKKKVGLTPSQYRLSVN